MFDRVSEKTLPVTVDSNGLSVADGYMLYRSNPRPVRGHHHRPAVRAGRHHLGGGAGHSGQRAFGQHQRDHLAGTAGRKHGNTITPEYAELDNASANVTLTVYQVRELPLAVDFINVPTGFDTSSLNYSLSQETMLGGRAHPHRQCR